MLRWHSPSPEARASRRGAMRRHPGAWPEPSRHAPRPRGVRALLIALGWLAACSPLRRGGAPGRPATASAGAERCPAIAKDGDVVRIDPGDYVDCAIWRASGLVLEAPDGAAHVRDRACGEKAIWVIAGDDVTVDNITFSGARAPDQNGAGIRAEGRNLTIRNSRFFDNENGILAAPVEGSTILIERSRFERNGKCAANCAHGVYVNRIDRLKIVGSTFREQRVGHHIKSGARARADRQHDRGRARRHGELSDRRVAGGEVMIADNVMAEGTEVGEPGHRDPYLGRGRQRPDGPGYRISGNRFRSDSPERSLSCATAPWSRRSWRATGSRATWSRWSGPGRSTATSQRRAPAADRAQAGPTHRSRGASARRRAPPRSTISRPGCASSSACSSRS